ncbi:MAG: hypothetical protein QME74_09100 [Candidatus Edwardsbacteria bacterium]|nr:hypothetical protein [Candidatus Edwardsbacteria bacterium]
MDYTKIVKQAWEIAWKRRYLWVFGFFAGMGGNVIGNIGGRIDSEQASGIASWLVAHPALAAGIVLGGLLLAIVFTVLQSLSMAGLISATGSLVRGQPNGFDATVNAGFRWFWRVFGMQVLLGLALIALIAITVVPPIILIVTKQAGTIALGAAWLVIVILPFFIVLIGAAILWDYAIRYAVLHDLTAGRAFSAGWRLLRDRLGQSVGIWAVMFGLGLAFGMILFVPMLVLGLPFLIAGMINPWLGIVPALLIGLPVVVALISVYGVFDVAYWSGAFQELTRTPEDPPQPAPPRPLTPAQDPDQPFELPPTAGMA